MKKVTIQTIAQKANVSIGTVDRALNNRGRINAETRKRILEIAENLGYKPNRIASTLSRQQTLRIAAITPKNPLFFYQHICNGFLDAIKDTEDYGVTVDQLLCDSLAYEDQVSVLERIDCQRYDGVVLNAGGNDLTPYINRIVEAGVPVVTFNSDADTSKRIFFVGENARKSGRMAGDMMGRLLGGKGKVAIMTSFFHPGAAANRRQGFLEALSAYPLIQVVADYEYNDRIETACQVASKIFDQYPDLDGLFSNSATGSVGCGKSKADHALHQRPVLIGYDVSEPVEQYLKDGLFDMVIDQQPRKQSYHAIMLLYRHLVEKWIPAQREVEVVSNMVMRYNAEDHTMDERAEPLLIR